MTTGLKVICLVIKYIFVTRSPSLNVCLALSHSNHALSGVGAVDEKASSYEVPVVNGLSMSNMYLKPEALSSCKIFWL